MYTRGKESRVIKKMPTKDFPGSPSVGSPRFHCRKCGFDPWSGTEILQATRCGQNIHTVVNRELKGKTVGFNPHMYMSLPGE